MIARALNEASSSMGASHTSRGGEAEEYIEVSVKNDQQQRKDTSGRNIQES